ncbi:MAG TPA: lysylphosphatidylglycerol synthase transmembrane domain-containing protein [Pseudolysinimonas sp.]|jgi:uncharacterized membrane protein YbhN (UPF0104 family)
MAGLTRRSWRTRLTRLAPKNWSPLARWLARIAAGALVVAAVVATVGAAPFLHGLASVSPLSLLVAVALTAIATGAAAWRWRTVAAGFGLRMRWRDAVVSYYRSQFLNTFLPGGVVGDVHRAYRHGQRSGSVALAARAVATERIAGQFVQLALVALVLASLGMTSPLRGTGWIVAGIAATVAIAIAIVAATARGRRMLRRESGMLRQLFGDPRRSVQVVASSVLIVACHSTVFIVACLVSGVHGHPRELVAIALIALTAAALPFNVGGWGPREGATAATFAVLGLGAAAGVAASTTFGVISAIALLPGAAVLIADRVAAIRARRLVPKSTIPAGTPAVDHHREEVAA